MGSPMLNTSPSSNRSGSLRERKKLRTRSAIAQVTVELVSAHGFDAVRVEDICEAAEVSRSTFFRYFDSKESCYVAGFHEGRLSALLDAVGRQPATEGPLRAIRNGFLDISEDWRETRQRVLLDAGIRASSPAVDARANAEFLTWEIAIALAVQARIRSPRGRPLKARLVAAVAMTAARLANDQYLADGARRSPAHFFNRMFDMADELMGGEARSA